MKLKTIALGSFLFLLTACNISFCGPVGGPQGGTGQPCRTDGRSPCDSGLICNGWNHCEACGGDGQLCCHPVTDTSLDGCGGGEHCSQTRCTHCGEVGEPVCQAPGMFVGGRCADGNTVGPGFVCVSGGTTPPTGPCASTSVFPVGCITAAGCFVPVTANGDTLEDARACAQMSLGAGCQSTTEEIGTPRSVCVKISSITDMTVSATATSDELAVSCAVATNGALSGTNGACTDGR